MMKYTISIEILFEQYKCFCYLPGNSFNQDPDRDITKKIYQTDLGMTPACSHLCGC
jgi:hypothetical protein